MPTTRSRADGLAWGFTQPAPKLDNQYLESPGYAQHLGRLLPADVLSRVEDELGAAGGASRELKGPGAEEAGCVVAKTFRSAGPGAEPSVPRGAVLAAASASCCVPMRDAAARHRWL